MVGSAVRATAEYQAMLSGHHNTTQCLLEFYVYCFWFSAENRRYAVTHPI